jgi:putative transcriptional regulator
LGGEEFSPLRHVPIFIGGPVGQEHLIFAALSWKPSAKALTCTTHLSLPDAIALQESGKHVRAFLGYSGWSSGQLEKELRGNSWITRRPEPSVLESKADESLWSTLLTTMGPYYKLLAGTPPNPELN